MIWLYASTEVDWYSWSPSEGVPWSIWQGIEQARRGEGRELTDDDLAIDGDDEEPNNA